MICLQFVLLNRRLPNDQKCIDLSLAVAAIIQELQLQIFVPAKSVRLKLQTQQLQTQICSWKSPLCDSNIIFSAASNREEFCNDKINTDALKLPPFVAVLALHCPTCLIIYL